MAHLDINKATVLRMYKDDIKLSLQDLMMSELEKDENLIDTAFVDECVNALLEIEQEENNFNALVPLMTSKQFMKKITGSNSSQFSTLNRFARVAVVAAVLAGSTFTANAAVEAVTGVNVIAEVGSTVKGVLEKWGVIKTGGIVIVDGEDDDDDVTTTTEPTSEPTTEETTTVPAVTEPSTTSPVTTTTTTTHHIDIVDGEDDDDVTTTKSTTKKKPGIEVVEGEDDDDDVTTTKPTTTEKPQETTTVQTVIPPNSDDKKEEEVYYVGLTAEYDNFKFDYIYGEALTYDGLILKALYSDGSTKPVSLEDCTYTKRINMNVTADYTLNIFYNGSTLEINITVRPDENTRGSEILSNDDYDYLLTDRGAYITAYKGSDTRINLDTVDDYKVIAICANVFKGKNIEMISAQEVEIVYDNAFKDCENLIDCFIPSAVSIGDSAFENCTALKEAVYSEKLYHLGRGAYRNTAIESITIPENITVIPEKLCEDCTALKEVTFEGRVTRIEKDAFSTCEELEKVNGTQYIEYVGEKAFYYDSKVEFDSSLDNLEDVGAYAFSNCKKLDFGSLPNLKTFDTGSFEYCYLLTEVTIPDGTKEIPNYAFIGTRLTALELPEGLERIGEYAFSATQITKVELPKSLKYIGNMGLYSSRMREVYFKNKNVEIVDNAFYAGSRLTFYVYENSTALKYAQENNIKYVIVDDGEPNIPVVDGDDD